MFFKNLEGYENLKHLLTSADNSTLSSLKTRGRCRYLFHAQNIDQLKEILDFCLKAKIEYYLLGEGTNTLLADDLKNMIVIKLGDGFRYFNVLDDARFECGASSNLGKLIVESAKTCFDLSFLGGIPGTAAGAVMGNSGSAQSGICDYVESVFGIFKDKNILTYKKKKIIKKNYTYRSFHLKGLVALTSIVLKPPKGQKDLILKNMRKTISIKKQKHPLHTKNIGCFFKNPPLFDYTAGQLIEICRLKGFRYGGAKVSEKHANFLENHSDASGSDILDLSNVLIGHVKENFGIKLHYEIKIIGF